MGLAYIDKRIRMDIKLIEVDETIFKEEIGNNKLVCTLQSVCL